MCTKSFVGWGFDPDPTGGAYSHPPNPLAAAFYCHRISCRGWGPWGKGRREGRGKEGGEGGEGSPGML